MKESATIAREYLKANASRLELKDFSFDKYDIHIHVPEGSTPKMALALGSPCLLHWFRSSHNSALKVNLL